MSNTKAEKHPMEDFKPLPGVVELCRVQSDQVLGQTLVVGFHAGRARWLIASQDGAKTEHAMRQDEIKLVLNREQALFVSAALNKTTP